MSLIARRLILGMNGVSKCTNSSTIRFTCSRTLNTGSKADARFRPFHKTSEDLFCQSRLFQTFNTVTKDSTQCSYIFQQRRQQTGSANSSGDLEEKNTLGKIEGTRKAIQYTCKVCGERNTNTFSKVAYEKGLVIVTCKGCSNRHLIADNLGWFKDIEHKNIEEILAAQGENIRRVVNTEDAMEVLGALDDQQKGDSS
ncbi:hypothetical protein ACOMHN_033453 [Nucella lapillus]